MGKFIFLLLMARHKENAISCTLGILLNSVALLRWVIEFIAISLWIKCCLQVALWQRMIEMTTKLESAIFFSKNRYKTENLKFLTSWQLTNFYFCKFGFFFNIHLNFKSWEVQKVLTGVMFKVRYSDTSKNFFLTLSLLILFYFNRNFVPHVASPTETRNLGVWIWQFD